MISDILLNEMLITMIIALFISGCISFVLGIIILIVRSGSKEIRSIAKQSAQLAQKGFAEEVAGLVGNASSLLSATNELIKTTAGIGVFLTLLGVALMIGSCVLALEYL
jgi:hypothetical protein